MRIPEDIRLLLIVLLTMGAVAGVAVFAIFMAPVINEYPGVSVRVIIALLLTFVTLKFILYTTEAAILIIGRKREDKTPTRRPTHPAIRAVVIILIIASAFFGWYLLLKYLKGIF